MWGSPLSSSPSTAPPPWACYAWTTGSRCRRPTTRCVWAYGVVWWVSGAGGGGGVTSRGSHVAMCQHRQQHQQIAADSCMPLSLFQVCNELASTIIENGVVRQATPEELAKAKVGHGVGR